MNRALEGAYYKGIYAALAGEPQSSCPYLDKRKPSGLLSWSRAFQNAWRDGWVYATKDREQALISVAYRPRRYGSR